MYKNPETGIYEADFRRKGVARLHLSYGVRTKVEARRLDEAVTRLFKGKHIDLIEQLRRGELSAHQLADHLDAELPIEKLRQVEAPADQPWPSVRAASEAMLTWLRENANKSAGTHDSVRSRYVRFCAFLNARRDLAPLGADTPLDDVLTATVEAYQSDLIASGAPINTVVPYVAQIGTLYRWQQRREERAAREEKRPARFLHIPLDSETTARGRTRRERYLLETEAERLLAACPDPLLFPVCAGLFAGLRIEETLHLRPGFDVDLELGLLVIQPQPTWTPKTKKRREVPIAPPLRPILERHLERYASEEWIVPSVSDPAKAMPDNSFTAHFKRVVVDAELMYGRKEKKGVVYHTLRHTFASWLIMRGVDLYTVAQLLGNSLRMVETTYGHLAPDFRQRALDRLADAVRMPIAPADLSETFATGNAT